MGLLVGSLRERHIPAAPRPPTPVILGQLRSQIALGEQDMDQHGPAKDSWVLVPIPEA